MNPNTEGSVVKAVLKETPPAAGRTPEQEAVKRINDELAKGKAHEAIEAAKKNKPIDAGKISKKAEEIGIGEKIDPATGKKDRSGSAAEQQRFQDFKDSAALNKEFLEKGYDGITDPAKKQSLRDSVQNAIISNPALCSEFSTLSLAEQRIRLEAILKDPKCASSLREVMNGVLDKEIGIKDREILDLKDAVVSKETRKIEATNEKKVFTDQITNFKTALKEFNRSATPPGLKAAELDGLLKGASTVQSELLNWKYNFQSLEGELAQLQDEKKLMLRGNRDVTDKENEIIAKKAELKTAKTEVDTRQMKIDRIKELQTEEANLKENQTQAEINERSKDAELKSAETDLSKANRLYQDRIRVRADQEDELVGGMKNALSEAANNYFVKELDTAEKAYNTISGEDDKKNAVGDEKAVYSAERKRWERVENAGTKKEKILICKDKVNADFLALIKDGGSENTLRAMLVGEGYAPDKIDKLFADQSDGSFYKKMTQEVTSQIVRRKILAGGITRADVFNIQNSNWGDGMIKSALEKNKAAAAEMQALLGEGVMDSGFMSKLWNETKKKPWLIATILGIIALPILASKAGASDIIK
jgi:hypothetical protein